MSDNDCGSDLPLCDQVNSGPIVFGITFNGIEFVPRPRWTREKPKEPGDYRYRDKDDKKGVILEVWADRQTNELMADTDDGWGPVAGLPGEWAGPLPLPSESDGRHD